MNARPTAASPPIYTKTGDDGTTGLLFGGRVSKANPIVEVCGALDEAVAALGLARTFLRRAERRLIAGRAAGEREEPLSHE